MNGTEVGGAQRISSNPATAPYSHPRLLTSVRPGGERTGDSQFGHLGTFVSKPARSQQLLQNLVNLMQTSRAPPETGQWQTSTERKAKQPVAEVHTLSVARRP